MWGTGNSCRSPCVIQDTGTEIFVGRGICCAIPIFLCKAQCTTHTTNDNKSTSIAMNAQQSTTFYICTTTLIIVIVISVLHWFYFLGYSTLLAPFAFLSFNLLDTHLTICSFFLTSHIPSHPMMINYTFLF